MRLPIKLTALFIIGFTMMNLAAHLVGGFQSLKPTLKGFVTGCESKPLPCWYGIVPGQTTVQEATDTLDKMGFQIHYVYNRIQATSNSANMCEFDLPYDGRVEVVQGFSVQQCGSLQLGDFIALLGVPNIVYSCYYTSANDQIPLLNLQYTGTYLFQKSSERQRGGDLALPNAFSTIEAVNFSTLVFSRGVEWRGFIAYWRYKQLEPNPTDFC